MRQLLARLPESTAHALRMALPNSFTILALCFGMTALLYADHGNIVAAIASVLVAAVLDACDGRVARATGCASQFGAELDSLSDVLCFGAAPAFIMYKWGLGSTGSMGWIVCLSFASACALRLARFNVTAADASRPAWMKGYFQGIPAPGGAFLVFLPVYANNAGMLGEAAAPHLALWLTPAVAALMVSTLPTFAAKALSRKALRIRFLPTFVFMAAAAAGLLVAPWPVLTLAGLAYLASVPVSRSMFRARFLRRTG